jgi:hypothetical protein
MLNYLSRYPGFEAQEAATFDISKILPSIEEIIYVLRRSTPEPKEMIIFHLVASFYSCLYRAKKDFKTIMKHV